MFGVTHATKQALDSLTQAPAPTILPRDLPIDPAVLEERRIQIRAQRHLKREQRTLETRRQTLESELATVKENLDSVNNRKRLTRSQAPQKLATFEPDQNKVFAVPMSAEDIAERSLSEDTRRAFAESRRAVIAARAQGNCAAQAAPQTSEPPSAAAEQSATPARGAKRARPGLDSMAASAAELCGALLTPVLSWLGAATPSAAPRPKEAAGIPSAAGHRGGVAMRVTAYKRFFYLHDASERRGPVTAAQLRHEWSCGSVSPQTLVFAANGTMRGWLAIAQLPPLLAFLRKPAVPGTAQGTVRRPLEPAR